MPSEEESATPSVAQSHDSSPQLVGTGGQPTARKGKKKRKRKKAKSKEELESKTEVSSLIFVGV